MKPHHFYPLAAHVLITLGLGFGHMIPGTCVAGVNALSIGFVASVAGTCLAYWAGIGLAVRRR